MQLDPGQHYGNQCRRHVRGDRFGLQSNRGKLRGRRVERNDAGFILTGQDLMRGDKRPRGWKPQRDPFLLETSVPGIFAAGDVRQGAVRRVASAVGEGAIAVSQVHQYLKTI